MRSQATRPKKGRPYFKSYLLAMNAAASDLFHERIGFISERKRNARVGVIKPKTGAKRRPNEMVDVVEQVLPFGPQHVYDLTVDNVSHGYGANGILVHNCATPEESFQHTTTSAFSPELLEAARLGTSTPAAFEVSIQ